MSNKSWWRMAANGMTAESPNGSARSSAMRVSDVIVSPAGTAKNPAGYRSIVLGSGVYAGRWRRQAAKFLKAHEAELAEKPVWLFSSSRRLGRSGKAAERLEFSQRAAGRRRTHKAQGDCRFPRGL